MQFLNRLVMPSFQTNKSPSTLRYQFISPPSRRRYREKRCGEARPPDESDGHYPSIFMDRFEARFAQCRLRKSATKAAPMAWERSPRVAGRMLNPARWAGKRLGAAVSRTMLM
jgi:hypothetical protein